MYQLYLWDPVEPGQKPQCNLPADEKYCNETQYPYKPYRECVFIPYDFCCISGEFIVYSLGGYFLFIFSIISSNKLYHLICTQNLSFSYFKL